MDKVLIDTSAWVEFLRRFASHAAEIVDQLIKNDRACVTGIVLAELLRGTRSTQERHLLLDKLAAVPFLETTRQAWIEAGTLAAALDQQGRSLPLTDVLIAAIAQANNCSVYTTDAHFARIPHLKLYRP